MKQLNLKDLIPQPAKLILSGTGDLVHVLRPVSLEDNVWIEENIGDEAAVQKMFEGRDYTKIAKLVFHLLEDKAAFLPIEEKLYDPETGEQTGTKRVGGYRALMRAVRGLNDQVALMKALLNTIGISEPIQEELAKADAEAEKKRAENLSESIGKKSSTSSSRNTATPTRKSRK